MNSNGGSAFPEIYLFGSLLLLSFPPAVNSILPVFMFSKYSLWLHLIFFTFEAVYYPALWIHINMPLCSQSSIARFFSLVLLSLGCVHLRKVTQLDPFQHPFCSSGTNHSLLACCKSLPLFVLLIFTTSLIGRLWICSCLEQFFAWVLLGQYGLFFDHPFGMCAHCRHLLISRASLSWMEVIFLNQNHVFHRGLAFSSWIFFSVALIKSMCISAFRHYWAILILYSYCLSIRLFFMFFWLPHFRPNRSVSSSPFVGMISRHLLPVFCRIFFRRFGMSYFICIALPFVDISLIFLHSTVRSCLFPQVVLLSFQELPIPFCSIISQNLPFVLSYSLSVFFLYQHLLYYFSLGFYYYYYYYYLL